MHKRDIKETPAHPGARVASSYSSSIFEPPTIRTGSSPRHPSPSAWPHHCTRHVFASRHLVLSHSCHSCFPQLPGMGGVRVCAVWLRVWLGGAGRWGWVSSSCSLPALSSPPTARFYMSVNKRCPAAPLEKLPCHCFLCTSPQPLLSSFPPLLSSPPLPAVINWALSLCRMFL